jgi:hypothetical protein
MKNPCPNERRPKGTDGAFEKPDPPRRCQSGNSATDVLISLNFI